MPRRKEIKKVLVIGSGPIVIGQAAEFDYAGTQALGALREEGIEVILLNSNPATIMTDKDIADKVYIEPLTEEFLLKILYLERPDGVLPTLGGQTGLNLAMKLAKKGVLERENIELLGTSVETIHKAEDRQAFRALMHEIGEPVPESEIVTTIEQGLDFAREIGFPLIIRPAYTLGGSGGGIAETEEELKTILKSGLYQSPIGQCLVERSIAGFKEVEYEVIRDSFDNAIIVCNMENIDPVGIHTGDSIVVAPVQTLSDKDNQRLRSASLKIIRALKIEGGCNVQLAHDPHSDQYYIIEVNPRVSRSSALASKATGYPIAKIAAKIAVGFGLHEIKNPVTKKTYACFEPALDYVVTKIPRWPFDKFAKANRRLGTQMKATGEVMAIGRNFEESILKAVRSLEVDAHHIELEKFKVCDEQTLKKKLKEADDERIFVLAEALRRNISIEEIHDITKIDKFFLSKFSNIIDRERKISERYLTDGQLLAAKKLGFTDKKIAELRKCSEEEIYKKRKEANIFAVYKQVDTCAAEFESSTPYYYSTYENRCEVEKSSKQKVVVLGSGPIRIGQGVEFDYATVHAVMAIRELGYEAIIINNNPETVSTDFDISDRLYFEPLFIEDVMNIIRKEEPIGVVVQFGGQTAFNLAPQLEKQGVKILGTSLESIDETEDRKRFEALLKELKIAQPLGTAVHSESEALAAGEKLGFPLMVRPSYVIGGRAMEIVYDNKELAQYLETAVEVNPKHPVLIDRYMIGTEIEVDAISDGETVFIPGIMEHIEKAGVHSGDSFAVYPPQTISEEVQKKLVEITTHIAQRLQVKGLINIQFVLKKNEVFVLEVNPRSSRTVPFLSKVTGVPMAKIATKAIMGKAIKDLGFPHGLWPEAELISIKAPVFSFAKLSDVDIALGPEMKSTGEVMGQEVTYEKALFKAFTAAGINIPYYGTILMTVADKHKDEILPLVEKYHRMGFKFAATSGTASVIEKAGFPVRTVNKIDEGGPTLIDEIRQGNVQLVINTLSKGKNVESDGFKLRRAAVENGIICLTYLDTAFALARALEINSYGVHAL